MAQMAPKKPNFSRKTGLSVKDYVHTYADKSGVRRASNEAKDAIEKAIGSGTMENWSDGDLKADLDNYKNEAWAAFDKANEALSESESDDEAAPTAAPPWLEVIGANASDHQLCLMLCARYRLGRRPATERLAALDDAGRAEVVAWGKRQWQLFRASDTTALGKRRAATAAAAKPREDWTPRKTAKLKAAVENAPATPRTGVEWDRVGTAVGVKGDLCRVQASTIGLVRRLVVDPSQLKVIEHVAGAKPRKPRLLGLDPNVPRGEAARAALGALSRSELYYLAGYVYNLGIPTNPGELVTLLVESEMPAVDPWENGSTCKYRNTKAFQTAFKSMRQKAQGAARTRNARLDSRQGDPWSQNGAAVLGDSDRARYERMYRNFCVQFAVLRGAGPHQWPRRVDMPFIVQFVKFPPFKDTNGAFDFEQHCYVCARFARDQGGYTFVEHDKEVSAQNLVSSRLTNCCMTCNSAWIAELDRIARVYGLNSQQKLDFACAYAAAAKRQFR